MTLTTVPLAAVKLQLTPQKVEVPAAGVVPSNVYQALVFPVGIVEVELV